MVYRSRDEIQAGILEAANRGAIKTRIMYAAAISHLQTSSYLQNLLEIGLIEYDSSIRCYRTTPKGIEFLKSFEQLKELID